jgi:hypothetical protein
MTVLDEERKPAFRPVHTEVFLVGETGIEPVTPGLEVAGQPISAFDCGSLRNARTPVFMRFPARIATTLDDCGLLPRVPGIFPGTRAPIAGLHGRMSRSLSLLKVGG